MSTDSSTLSLKFFLTIIGQPYCFYPFFYSIFENFSQLANPVNLSQSSTVLLKILGQVREDGSKATIFFISGNGLFYCFGSQVIKYIPLAFLAFYGYSSISPLVANNFTGSNQTKKIPTLKYNPFQQLNSANCY